MIWSLVHFGFAGAKKAVAKNADANSKWANVGMGVLVHAPNMPLMIFPKIGWNFHVTTLLVHSVAR